MDESRRPYNDDDDSNNNNNNNNNNSNNNNIKFKTSMRRSSLCNYSDAYILVKGTITVPNTASDGAAVNNTNKVVTGCRTKINNTQEDNVEYNDIVICII